MGNLRRAPRPIYAASCLGQTFAARAGHNSTRGGAASIWLALVWKGSIPALCAWLCQGGVLGSFRVLPSFCRSPRRRICASFRRCSAGAIRARLFRRRCSSRRSPRSCSYFWTDVRGPVVRLAFRRCGGAIFSDWYLRFASWILLATTPDSRRRRAAGDGPQRLRFAAAQPDRDRHRLYRHGRAARARRNLFPAETHLRASISPTRSSSASRSAAR